MKRMYVCIYVSVRKSASDDKELQWRGGKSVTLINKNLKILI